MNKPQSTPKFINGDIVKSTGFGGTSDKGLIDNIRWIYHARLNEWTWGYKVVWENNGAGYTGEYYPESYLSFFKNS